MSGSASRSADASCASACDARRARGAQVGALLERPRRRAAPGRSAAARRVGGSATRRRQLARRRQAQQRGQLAARDVQLHLRVDDGVLVAQPLELDLAQLGLGDVARPEARLRQPHRLAVAVGDLARQLPLGLLAHHLGEGRAHGVDDLAQRVLGQQPPLLDALARPRACARCAWPRRR